MMDVLRAIDRYLGVYMQPLTELEKRTEALREMENSARKRTEMDGIQDRMNELISSTKAKQKSEGDNVKTICSEVLKECRSGVWKGLPDQAKKYMYVFAAYAVNETSFDPVSVNTWRSKLAYTDDGIWESAKAYFKKPNEPHQIQGLFLFLKTPAQTV